MMFLSLIMGEPMQTTASTGVLANKSNVDNVECRVCNDVFGFQGDKVPRLLFCGHTVCHQCLTRLSIQEHFNSFGLVNKSVLLCPFDRQPTEVGDSGVWGLKKNFALIELLEKLQQSNSTPYSKWKDINLEKEKELSIPCEENEQHTAVLYCTVCDSHLCWECSNSTHSTRTLGKHRQIPLSEKPRELPRCTYHNAQLVEFVCLEEGCSNTPLMCYICKDFGRHLKHKHALLQSEAENVRGSIYSAVQHIRSFSEEVTDWARKVSLVIQQIEGGYSSENMEGQNVPLQIPGSADDARAKIRQYFNDLHENLKRQEVTALAVVDTHVRERLCMLKQQQEDMAMLLSQVTSVCQQCEFTSQQDDAKVVLAKEDVCSLLDTIKKQQHHFSELPEQVHLDPVIPITFTKDNRVHIGPKMEMRVVTLGLDDSGKTSILFQLKQSEFIQTLPTIGFNVESVEYKNLKITMWDVGGQPKLRPLWKHYYFNTQALVYVIDSSNYSRMSEAFNELTKLLQEKELREAPLLIFANKQDLSPCLTIEEMTSEFNLFKSCCSRSWHIQACDAKSGAGLYDGLEWLSHQLVVAGV